MAHKGWCRGIGIFFFEKCDRLKKCDKIVWIQKLFVFLPQVLKVMKNT